VAASLRVLERCGYPILAPKTCDEFILLAPREGPGEVRCAPTMPWPARLARADRNVSPLRSCLHPPAAAALPADRTGKKPCSTAGSDEYADTW